MSHSPTIPLTDITGMIQGPLNVQYYVPTTAPNASAIGAGGGAVFVASGVDTSFPAASAPAPENLTAQGKTVSWLSQRGVAAALSNSFGESGGNDAAGAMERMVGATALGALLARRCDTSSGLRSGLYATREWCWFAGSARANIWLSCVGFGFPTLKLAFVPWYQHVYLIMRSAGIVEELRCHTI
ncbi:hypothetical protein EDB92DRAFT_1850804 [Lactarius akahatsu]|uniref:Uncharacterized protein n=1 Tax=Lactarius akahatsu TaxID=416441 RepID=A0AAD4LKA7_9AGAM|nr:hypothetical protein EDB92DRAFT_1850804 [Lactarius akahatsu]